MLLRQLIKLIIFLQSFVKTFNRIKEELAIKGGRVMGNDVYAYCGDFSNQEVIDDQGTQLEHLHGNVSDCNKRIPKLFLIPKIHKRPYKYRFIAGAGIAATKQLSVDMNLCLRLIKKCHKGYCKTIYNKNGYNYFSRVDNYKEVLDKLNNVNNPSSMHTYDFSTLYINLPLDLVKKELFQIIDIYFNINEKKSNKYIRLNHFWRAAQFGSTNKKCSYDREKLKEALK